MRFIRLPIFLSCLFCFAGYCKGQEASNEYSFNNTLFLVRPSGDTGSAKYLLCIYHTTCKGYFTKSKRFPQEITLVTDTIQHRQIEKSSVKLLSIHGNISYEFLYQSNSGLISNQTNLQQHTERINLNVLYKERVPIKISFTSRQSNSPYFKNYIDPNIQLNRVQFVKSIKQRLVNSIEKQIYENPDLEFSEAALKELISRYVKLKSKFESPSMLQKLIEEKEHFGTRTNRQVKTSNSNRASNNNVERRNKKTNQSYTEDQQLQMQPNSILSKSGSLWPSKARKVFDEFQGDIIKKQRQIIDTFSSKQKNILDSLIVKSQEISNRISNTLSSIDDRKDSASKVIEQNLPSIRSFNTLGEKDSCKQKVGEYSKLGKDYRDSISGEPLSIFSKEKKELDSLSKKIYALQKRCDSLRFIAHKQLKEAGENVNKAANKRELNNIARTAGVKLIDKRKFESYLVSVKQFSIGKTMLNYTELTAQNLPINGINIEYNPSWYIAFAGGKIDYKFRDFFNRESKQRGQYFIMGRIGVGNIEKKALIFSLFQGRKNQSEFSLPDSINNHLNITGYSVEAIFKKDEFTAISAEFAKSTIPFSGNLQNTKQGNSLWKFSDNSNTGINIKAQTIIPETNTRINGFFRKSGEHFQSFSLFGYNTNQTAWLAAINQSIYKNQIVLTGMLRQNDFTNPFTDKTFKTSTVFKSFVANIRIPKYPFLTVGYYPGTQFYIVNKERVRENAYYVLNGSLVYNYFFKGQRMTSSVILNRYTNQATDSGFALYKGVNYYISQSIYLKAMQFQGTYSVTKQPELRFCSIESSLDFSISKNFKVGGGIKYNRIEKAQCYWGDKIFLTADFKKLGQLQMQYEKNYLPTTNKTLYPVETGRVAWYKYF